jgi:hypothetical protein
MQILPKNEHEWLRFVLFPFKAFTVIAPFMFFVSVSLHPSRRFGPTDAEILFVMLLFYDALLLIFAGLVLALIGPKGYAIPVAGFGLAALALTQLLLPALAR